MNSRVRQPGGFTSVELLLVLALSAVVIGGAVVSFGTIVRSQPRVSSSITVPLGTTRMLQFYGLNASTIDTGLAPQYGALSYAEELREQFLNDTISATAVYCLAREGANTWKPSLIAYDATQHDELDTPQKFRAHIVAHAGVNGALYLDYRNPLADGATVPQNASIFLLGYSKFTGYLKVNAIYDIDFVRFTAASQPNGTHASVKRYADSASAGELTTTSTLVYTSGYNVFFPPSVPSPRSSTEWDADGFSPPFITFERAERLAWRETTLPDTVNRFKRASERPFYLIWWPDPAARHLGNNENSIVSGDPRNAYNHMAGRTAFMFTVPMFPAL